MKKHIYLLIVISLLHAHAFATNLPIREELYTQQKIDIRTCEYFIENTNSYIVGGIEFVSPTSEEIYSIDKGIVIEINPLDMLWASEILIADSLNSNIGWLYRYIDSATLNIKENQSIPSNYQIGSMARNDSSLNIVQLFRVSYIGEEKGWMPIQNPLRLLNNFLEDIIPPKIEPLNDQIIRFREDDTYQPLNALELYGNVDILFDAYDIIKQSKTSIYQITCEIFSEDDLIRDFSFRFDEPNLQALNTKGMEGDFTYNITDLSWENENYWNTLDCKDGEYNIRLTVYDAAGNYDTEEIEVNIRNNPIVELSYFTAKYENNCVILDWETTYETMNLSYEIYKNNSRYSDSFVCLTQEPIQAIGSSLTNRYSYIDKNINKNDIENYIYQLHLKNDKNSESILKSTLVYYSKKTTEDFLKIYQNQPNPFNPETEITYELLEPGIISVIIYDSAGKMIKKLVDTENGSPGIYQLKWDGKNDRGLFMPSGIYFCQIDINPLNSIEIFSQNIRMILLK